jgi:hypothetical protein
MALLMQVKKYKKGGKLKVSSATKSVPAPGGFHWMEQGGRYFLMKGDYAPHPGAVKEAKFKIASHG